MTCCHDQATRDIFKMNLQFPFIPEHKSEKLKDKSHVYMENGPYFCGNKFVGSNCCHNNKVG